MSAQNTSGRVEAQCVNSDKAYLVANVDGKNQAIARVMIGLPEGPHNLRRLAACWNAFEHMSTEAIEELVELGGVAGLTSMALETLNESEEMLAVLQNFEIKGPDDDKLVWLVLHGNGTSGKGMFNLGEPSRLAAQVALELEKDRRAAITKAESQEGSAT